MKTIFNWTAGSFFRSIGRIIAYIVIGCLIGMIINYNNIKIPNVFEYTVESDIKLASNSGFYVGSATYSGGANGTYINTSLSSDGYWIIPDSNLTTGSKTLYFKFNENKTFQTGASEYLINIKFSHNNTSTSTTTETQYRCNIHNNEETVYDPNGAIIDFENQYDYFTCNQHTSTTTTNSPSYSLTLYYTYGNNDYNYIPCNAISNSGDIYSFKCPVGSTDIRGLRVSVGTTYTGSYTLGFSPTSRYYIDQQQQIIDNQQTQIQQQQETNNTLNDDDTSDTSSDATDFFNDTTISSGGSLTSIVSSPLYVINNLVTGSSSDLCVTLKSKNICLPSGNIIWGKTQRSGVNWFGSSDDISSGVNAFKAFFNLVVGGYICYKIVIGLILCIDRILTPTHTEIEVMKL